MEKFFWREAENRPALNRYSGEPAGIGPWRELVSQISGDDPDRHREAFDEFLAGLDHVPHKAKPTCCLFISHRRSDVSNALHIAWIATQAGFDYWLDIHDPTLIALTQAPIPSPAKDILLAAVIEMGLLNSTHVIALHTRYSIGSQPNNLSKWIPYELGRAKARRIRSDQAACWFDRHTPVAACGEYVHLVRHTYTAQDISDWLAEAHRGHGLPAGDRAQGRCRPTDDLTWKHGTPPPLDP